MTYALDVTGIAVENKVLGTTVTITPSPSTYLRLIPVTGPFYSQSVYIRYTPALGNSRVLTEGVDYYFGYLFQDASIKTRSQVYGAIVLSDNTLNGTLTYSLQTLGAPYELTVLQVATIIAGEMRDPNLVSWESVCTARSYALAAMPVVDYAYTRASSQEFNKLTSLLDEAGLAVHLRPKFLPTPGDTAFIPSASEIGLGNVDNFKTATTAQAAAGTANNLFVTPAGMTAAVNAQVAQQLAVLGYQLPVTYRGALSVVNTTQTYLFEGDVWVARSDAIPFTTTGVFEYSKFVLVTSNSRDYWQSLMFTITGTESKTALNEVILPLGVTVKSRVKSSAIINDIVEAVAGVDYRFDGNNLILNAMVSTGDVILLRFKQLKSRVADQSGYCKSYVITNTSSPLTLTDFSGISASDVQVRLNDLIILNPLRGDYTITGSTLTISYHTEIGDTVEVTDLDSLPEIGTQAMRSVLFATM